MVTSDQRKKPSSRKHLLKSRSVEEL